MTEKNYYTPDSGKTALQRLTALWAFTESGLGGILHAFKMPFTGVVIGGMAIILLSLIAFFSSNPYKEILKSTLIVLIVKAAVSPHTPFPAYIAVSFQGIMAVIFFTLLRVNLLSILLLSIIAMLESAFQKLLLLTILFGKSLWKATDEMMNFIAQQFNTTLSNGSYWIMGLYLVIYLLAGIITALLAFNIIKGIREGKEITPMVLQEINRSDVNTGKRKGKVFKVLLLFFGLLIISVVLFISAKNKTQAWVEVAKSITWTLSAILLWYIIIIPLFTKIIAGFLRKEKNRYFNEVDSIIRFFPALRKIAAAAWQQSTGYRGLKKISFFVIAVINWSLVWEDEKPVKE